MELEPRDIIVTWQGWEYAHFCTWEVHSGVGVLRLAASSPCVHRLNKGHCIQNRHAQNFKSKHQQICVAICVIRKDLYSTAMPFNTSLTEEISAEFYGQA
eukprot:104883-Amphidinium_carterae.1